MALKKRVTLGTAVSFIIILVLALDLGHETMSRFREARTEELVLSAIEKWRKNTLLKFHVWMLTETTLKSG